MKLPCLTSVMPGDTYLTLGILVSDLNHNATRCKLFCVESEVIGSGDSTIKIILILPRSYKKYQICMIILRRQFSIIATSL